MICHPSEFDFYLCSHSGIKVMIGRTNHNFTLQWNWNNFTSSVNSFFFCIWTGDEPSNTLSCSFRWKWVQGWYAANLNLQSLLHVSLLCRFTLRWTVHASSPLFTILTWCNPFFLGWSLACSYARCTRAVSIGMRYLVGFSFIQLSELIFLSVIFLSVVLFFFFTEFCYSPIWTVPPAYYAHLGAFRARYYMEDEHSDQGSSSSVTTRTDRSTKPLPEIKENVKRFMFYCWRG